MLITAKVVSSNPFDGGDQVYQWIFLGNPVSSIKTTDRHDITELLLKVALKHNNPNLQFYPLGRNSREVIKIVNNKIVIIYCVSDCCLTPSQQFFSYVMAWTS